MAISIPIISEFDSRGLRQAQKAFAGLQAQTSKVGQTIKRGFMVATAAVAGLAAAGFSAVKAAIEDQKAQALLERQLKTSTKATDAQVKAIEKSITSLSLWSGVADDELRPALAVLVRSTRNTTKAQKALRVALNVSRATGRPLVKVSEALARAYGGNVKALARLDPSLKSMITKTTTADQAVSMLSRNFQGAARTAAETMQGRMERLSVAFNETKEAVGTALLPYVERFATFVQDKLIPYAQKLQDEYGAAGVAGVFRMLGQDFNKATENNRTFTDTMINLVTAIAIVGAALKGLVEIGQFYVAAKKAKEVLAGLNAAFIVLKAVSLGSIAAAFSIITLAVYELISALRDPIFRSAFGEFLINSAKLVGNAFIALYKVIRAALNPVIALLQKIPGIGGKFGLLPDVNFQKFTFDANAPGFSNPRQFESSAQNNVQINVNGGDPQAVVDALRRYYRQNGPIPVAVTY